MAIAVLIVCVVALCFVGGMEMVNKEKRAKMDAAIRRMTEEVKAGK